MSQMASSTMAVSSSSSGNASSVAGSSSSSSGAVSGPQVYIHVRATAATFNHTDGLSGQTPREHIYGIRGLKLLRSMGDPAPVLVFDHGANYVEAPLSDGADTVVGQIAAALLPNETFTYGRVVLSHIGYHVDATMHASGNNLPGEFRNLHILGNNVTIDATTWQRGDYRYLFHSIAGDFPQQGTNGPLPTVPAAGGVTLVAEGDEVVLYLPANIVTSPDVTADVQVSFVLNTHQSFRWQDQATAPNTAGTFDATPTGTEPVMHFGANSYNVTVE